MTRRTRIPDFFIALVLTVLILIGSFISSAIPSYGYDSSKDSNDPKDGTTWNQCVAFDGYDPNSPLGFDGSGSNKCAASCSNWALTGVLVRSGSKPSGYMVPDFRKEVQALIDAGKPAPSGPSGFTIETSMATNAEAISNMTKGTLEFVDYTKDTSGSITKDTIKKQLDEGYFLMLLVHHNGGTEHWVMPDFVDDNGVIHLMDSGFPYTDLDHAPAYLSYYGYVRFKRTDGVKFSDLPTLASVQAGGNDGTVSVPDLDSREGQAMLVKESDLIGMQSLTEGQKLQLDLSQDAHSRLILPTSITDLSYQDRANVTEMESTLRHENEVFWPSIFRNIFSFIGLSLCLFTIFLLSAYALDVASPLNVEFTKKITFNQFHADPHSKFTSAFSLHSRSSRPLGYSSLVVIEVSIFLLGTSLIAGIPQKVVATIIRVLSAGLF